ncbi:MAG: carbohydrate-binding protein [Paludibacteraceae bacterium]|nr:carbohydrate-binding protein [Paludibacteraceae bacterium]
MNYNKHSFIASLVFAWMGIASINTYAADATLTVNLSDSIRPVTHVATGSLYGLTESLPSDIDNNVAPLKPNVFLCPARSGRGYQQGIGGAFKVSPRIANTTGKVQIRLADILPGWPYQFKNMDAWKDSVRAVVRDKKNAKIQNFDGYEIWNEPDGTWKNTSIDFNAGLWKQTYDLLRQLDPGAKIIGPSYSWYNSSRMDAFLKYCSQNNCLPDVISWHQWGSGGFVGAIENLRSLERKYNISPRAISINEYSSDTHTLEGCPGVSVPFIAKFERHGVESAMISWWFTNLPGRLGSLLTANNERGGGWYLYKWYGDMSGYMAKVTPPNDKSDGVDGFAAVNLQKKVASIVLGGNTVGTTTVKISGIPARFGNKVMATVEQVTWADKDKAVNGTTVVSSNVYNINNGYLQIPVNVANAYYAYRISLKPVIEQAPYNGVAQTLPGVIEMEKYDVGGEGVAYHDEDDLNSGKVFRGDEGVDLDGNDEDGYVLGWTKKGEWLAYTIDVKESDNYTFEARVASGLDGSAFSLSVDGKPLTGIVEVPNTGSWTAYETVSGESVELTEGKHVLKLNVEGAFCNIDYIEFKPVQKETTFSANATSLKTSIPSLVNSRLFVSGEPVRRMELYSTDGRLVQTSEDNSMDVAGLENGVYVLRAKTDVEVASVKVIVRH